MNKLVIAILFGWVFASNAYAQDTTNVYDLDKCIAFAMENHESIKNGLVDLAIAEADVKQTRGQGLPQVKLDSEFDYFYQIPTTLVPAGSFDLGEDFSNWIGGVSQATGVMMSPPSNEEEFNELQFGTNYSAKAGVSASQLIFSGSYFVGLQAANRYRDLMNNSLNKTKVDVVESVTKAYYNVLMVNEQVETIDANMDMLVALYKQMEGLYQAGFVQKIDLDRVEVNLNNLKTEKENYDKLKVLSNQLLKYQMGMSLNQPLQVIETLASFEIPIVDDKENVIPENRLEYQILQEQKNLYGLEKKLNQSTYLPTVAAFANHSYNGMTNKFGDVFTGKWFPTGLVGVTLSVPLFTGFQTKYKVQKSVLNMEKLDNSMAMFKRSVELQASQSATSLKTAIATLDSKKANMKLAEKVYNNAVEKNKLGAADVFEVTSSYTDFRTAQTNYYNAIYDVIVAKIELDKAKGVLK